MVFERSPDSLFSQRGPIRTLLLAVMVGSVGCSAPQTADSTRPVEPEASGGSRNTEASVADRVEQFVSRVQPIEQSARVVWLDAGMGPDADTSMDAPAEIDPPVRSAPADPPATGEADPKLFIAGVPDDAEPAPSPEPTHQADKPDRAATTPVFNVDATVNSQSLSDLTSEVLPDDSSPFALALRAAARSAARGGAQLDPAVLKPLDPNQRRAVEQYHRMVTAVSATMKQRSEPLTLDMLRSALQEVLDAQPLRIGHAELCRRVSGYGVYDPVPAAFVRGRPIRTIVYVELENFTSIERSPHRHEVQLSQELVLYNESDGAAVWSHAPVRIVDKSRNTRRDFFTVQLITLPAELNVGKYLLKVRITDHHADSGGAVCEQSIPITIVASDAMVDRSRR